jgi:nicotinamidase-related amidase
VQGQQPLYSAGLMMMIAATAARPPPPRACAGAAADRVPMDTGGGGIGGLGIDPKRTAVIFIEFQNEFTSAGGKLHPAVRDVMVASGMLPRSAQLAKDMRRLGIQVIHAPISFAADGSDNPNRHLGILAGCDRSDLFTRGSWGAQICPAMGPVLPGDIVVTGKRGLSAFPGTDLEAQLKQHGIDTIALAGFMANCCVESTMREACEKGYNVVTLTDCVATTSFTGNRAAIDITYPFFSTPMNAASFTANVTAAAALSASSAASGSSNKQQAEAQAQAVDAPLAKRPRVTESPTPVPAPRPTAPWAFASVAEGVYQAGPWFADVRRQLQGDELVLRSGRHELQRYLTFAQAAAAGGCCSCRAHCDASIYSRKLPAVGAGPESTTPFGWMCNMTVVRLPGGGCLIYSPVLGEDNTLASVVAALEEHALLPVRIMLAPTPQHHLALKQYQDAFPDACLLCGKASGQMPALTRKRRDLRFDGVVTARARPDDGSGAGISGPGSHGGDVGGTVSRRAADAWALLSAACDVLVMDDNRTGEVVLLHKKSQTLILSDVLYKADNAVAGPGGPRFQYSSPDWFAAGQHELFYGRPGDNADGLLPSYRTHPRLRTLDLPGMRRSLDALLSWGFARVLACHTDPLTGGEARALIKRAWGWVWHESGAARGLE